jgi:hypothetical protein
MKKTVEVYALIVCFFALMWFAVTLGLFLNQLVRITFPQLTTPISHYNNSASQTPLTNPKTDKGNAALQGKVNEQMQAIWEANYKMSIEQERRDALRNSIHQLINLIISALIFAWHWRLIQSEKFS